MAQCIATIKRTGAQCRMSAITGGTVCRMHGGSAPQVRAAANRRVAQANLDGQIGRLLVELAGEPMVGHVDGLEAACDRLGRMVAALSFVAQGRDALARNRFGEEVPDPAVEMYGRWLVEYTRACKLAIDVGIDERRVRLSEMETRSLFDAATAAAADVGMPSAMWDAYRSAWGQRLRRLENGDDA